MTKQHSDKYKDSLASEKYRIYRPGNCIKSFSRRLSVIRLTEGLQKVKSFDFVAHFGQSRDFT